MLVAPLDFQFVAADQCSFLLLTDFVTVCFVMACLVTVLQVLSSSLPFAITYLYRNVPPPLPAAFKLSAQSHYFPCCQTVESLSVFCFFFFCLWVVRALCEFTLTSTTESWIYQINRYFFRDPRMIDFLSADLRAECHGMNFLPASESESKASWVQSVCFGYFLNRFPRLETHKARWPLLLNWPHTDGSVSWCCLVVAQ